jgi:hypothetical protein
MFPILLNGDYAWLCCGILEYLLYYAILNNGLCLLARPSRPSYVWPMCVCVNITCITIVKYAYLVVSWNNFYNYKILNNGKSTKAYYIFANSMMDCIIWFKIFVDPHKKRVVKVRDYKLTKNVLLWLVANYWIRKKRRDTKTWNYNIRKCKHKN